MFVCVHVPFYTANKSKAKSASAAAGGASADSQEVKAGDSPIGMTDSPNNTPPKQESSSPGQATAAASSKCSYTV